MMEEAPKLVVRERKPADSLSVVSAPVPLQWEHLPHEHHLLDYVMILWRHQWLILTFLLTVVTIVTIASFKMKPIYLATARVEVDREAPGVLPFQDVNSYDMFMDEETYLETQTRILQSETLAMMTIRSLDLSRYPELGGNPRARLITSPEGLEKRPAILGAFLGRLTVKRVPNSRLIEVQFEDENSQLAAQVVNTHLQNYIEQNFRSRYDAITQSSNWLSSELEELRVKMEKSEDAQIAYEKQNQIWTIDANQNTTTQKLADLSRTLTDVQTELTQKEAMDQLAHSNNPEALPAIMNNPVMAELMKKKNDLDEEYTDALNQFGPNYPKVKRLLAEKQEVEKAFSEAEKDVTAQIDADYQEARAREALLERELDKQKNTSNELSEKLVEYNILKHDAESNKELYDGMLQKLKEAGITAGLRSSNIRIVDPALVPTTPARPQKARNILLALFVGLVGGIGLAFLREYLDNTVKSPDDIETLTRLPSLAVVPSFEHSNGHGRLPRIGRQAGLGGEEEGPGVVALERPKSLVSEAFRSLRTSLLLSQAEHPPQVLLVTSALPKEGKTTAAVNLAVTLAQLGDRTLLLDADLRKPGIRRALGLPQVKDGGLSSYLAGANSIDSIVVPHPVISNLSAITTGPIPPSPADLLSSHRMREAIEDLRQHFKFVVLDSPPIMAATDAVILSALVDGVLLVVRSSETPKQAFTRARDMLMTVKARLLGVVLNAVNPAAPDYYYYYAYRYYPYADVEGGDGGAGTLFTQPHEADSESL